MFTSVPSATILGWESYQMATAFPTDVIYLFGCITSNCTV
ncbi:hypothetical protein ASD8599_01382 [Ascidiaceihabitans donghaensis]|uniref:Uncharacterized protein n=1 Tax=Ascidiaceihabitans donghaensis TaxID=1510460 RepID=A0A2R8BC49_9RHOB|nr:hypothetical protein ASD8599_01382 [Ascidiaceihabitans donghaensis]